MPLPLDNHTEWLEPDGLGGFASGTTSGERTRRYHALLLTATNPPTGRMVLVNGFDAWIETSAGRFPISTQRYPPNVIYPADAPLLSAFQIKPWPQWTFSLPDGTTLMQELFVPRPHSACALRWTFNGRAHATLTLRPLLSGRDYHATHHENSAFRFEPEHRNGWLVWRPYDDVPEICALANGQYTHAPEWYRNFLYVQEQERGLDCIEDLPSPGTFQFDLSQPAVLIFAAQGHDAALIQAANSTTALPRGEGRGEGAAALATYTPLAKSEQQRRSHFPTPLHRSANNFLVRRGAGQTIIAGYPWFTDWGRDTFISLRGLCLALGCRDVAAQILLAWSTTVSEGMLPNRFPDSGDVPEFNSVDASLWFIIAVHELLNAAAQRTPSATAPSLTGQQRAQLEQAVLAIVAGYSAGTRYGIRQDVDGLLAAGLPGLQLTWMDAKVGDRVITPRVGKPVEVQALWLNSLWIAGRLDKRWAAVFDTAQASFERRFWNTAAGCLYDVVDVDHQPGSLDASLRPNQIFAVGGLPLALLHGDRARRVVDTVEARLLTPLGLRTLAPGSPDYAPQCIGPPEQRDAAYHQGTVWPWLIGPFVEAWIRVRGGTPAAKAQARERFLPPLEAHLHTYGLNHLSEIADGDPPHTPRGCPFQAWSLGEFLRLQHDVLRD